MLVSSVHVDFLQCCIQALASRLDEVGPAELAQLVWSLGRLGVRPSPGLVSALQQQVVDMMDVLRPQETAMILDGHSRSVWHSLGLRACIHDRCGAFRRLATVLFCITNCFVSQKLCCFVSQILFARPEPGAFRSVLSLSIK